MIIPMPSCPAGVALLSKRRKEKEYQKIADKNQANLNPPGFLLAEIIFYCIKTYLWNVLAGPLLSGPYTLWHY